MNKPVKVFFDECIGKPMIESLVSRLGSTPYQLEVKHLVDIHKSGTPDDVWIPTLAGGDWIVITADRGRKSSTKKLPDICKENRITHVMLSASIHSKNSQEKLDAILAVWQELIQIPSGSRFLLRQKPGGGFTLQRKP